MTRSEIVEKVNSFLIEDFEIEESLLAEDNLIKEQVGIDSLDMVDIIVTVNDVFGFKLEKSELAAVKTLGQFYDLIAAHVG